MEKTKDEENLFHFDPFAKQEVGGPWILVISELLVPIVETCTFSCCPHSWYRLFSVTTTENQNCLGVLQTENEHLLEEFFVRTKHFSLIMTTLHNRINYEELMTLSNSPVSDNQQYQVVFWLFPSPHTY